MAFTGAERARIRSLLGWGARFHHLETRLENALDALADLPDDENLIKSYLTQLTTIDTAIADCASTFGVKKTGSIELESDQGLGFQKSEGRRLVEAIADILGVDINRNFYGGSIKGGPMQYG